MSRWFFKADGIIDSAKLESTTQDRLNELNENEFTRLENGIINVIGQARLNQLQDKALAMINQNNMMTLEIRDIRRRNKVLMTLAAQDIRIMRVAIAQRQRRLRERDNQGSIYETAQQRARAREEQQLKRPGHQLDDRLRKKLQREEREAQEMIDEQEWQREFWYQQDQKDDSDTEEGEIKEKKQESPSQKKTEPELFIPIRKKQKVVLHQEPPRTIDQNAILQRTFRYTFMRYYNNIEAVMYLPNNLSQDQLQRWVNAPDEHKINHTYSQVASEQFMRLIQVMTGDILDAPTAINAMTMAIKKAVAELKTMPESQTGIITNVLVPLYEDLRTIIKPITDGKMNNINGQDVAPLYEDYHDFEDLRAKGYLDEERTNAERWAPAKFSYLNNFFKKVFDIAASVTQIQAYRVNRSVMNVEGGVFRAANEDEMFTNIIAENQIDIMCQMMGITKPIYTRLKNMMMIDANFDIRILMQELYNFAISWFQTYWEHPIAMNFMKGRHAEHSSSLLAQLFFSSDYMMTRVPNTQINISEEEKNALRSLTDVVDPIRYFWTYVLLNLMIRAVNLDDLELRVVKVLFFPHDTKYIQLDRNNVPLQFPDVNNYLPLHDNPFMVPYEILRNIEGQEARTEVAPLILLAKSMTNSPSLIKVDAYAIRHGNHTTPSFQIRSEVNHDKSVFDTDAPQYVPIVQYAQDQINASEQARMDGDHLPVNYNPFELNQEPWTGLQRTSRTVASIIKYFRPEIDLLFEQVGAVPEEQILNHLSIRILATEHSTMGVNEFRNYAMNYWHQHDIFQPDIAPYVILTINFATSTTNNLAQENPTQTAKMCEIPITIAFGPRFIEKHNDILKLAADSIESINFWAEQIIKAVRRKMGEDFTENEQAGFDELNSDYAYRPQFKKQDEIYRFSCTGMSFQLVHKMKNTEEFRSAWDYATTNRAFRDDTTKLRINGIVGARQRVNAQNTKFFNQNKPAFWITESVFNPAALPRCMREIYNAHVDHYNQVIDSGQSCLGAVAATLIAAMNPVNIELFDDLDTLTFTDNVTRYGYTYFKNSFTRLKQKHSTVCRELRVIMGSGDPVLQYIHKYVKVCDYSVPISNTFAPQFDTFTIPLFHDNEELFGIELDTSRILEKYQKYFREPLNLAQFPRRVIVVVQNSQHVFFPKDYFQAYLPALEEYNSIYLKKKKRLPRASSTIEIAKQFPRAKDKKNILIVYDMETSCGKDVVMRPYMLAYQIIQPPMNSSMQLPDVQLIQESDQSDSIPDKFFDVIDMVVSTAAPGTKIQVHAYNGSRFDHVFLVPRLFERYRDCYLIGNPSNVKLLQIDFRDNVKVQFVDTKLMSGSGSLNDFCKSMGQQLKTGCDEILSIRSRSDWLNSSLETKFKIGDYCKNDVAILSASILRFNEKILQTAIIIYEKLQGKKTIRNQMTFENKLFVRSTLAATAFVIVDKLIRRSPIALTGDKALYNAMRSSYYGGVTQCFSLAKYTTHPELSKRSIETDEINYVDKNSLYPFIMASKRICGQFKTIQKTSYIIARMMRDQLIPSALYGLVSFQLNPFFKYGFLPVRSCKSKRIYYPLSWDRRSEDPVDWNDNLIWVWGFALEAIMDIEEKAGVPIRQSSRFDVRAHCQPEFPNDVKIMFPDMGTLYKMRFDEEDPVVQKCIKLIMNSAYGKYGQREFGVEHYLPSDLVKAHSNNRSFDYLLNALSAQHYNQEDIEVKQVIPFIGNGITRLDLQIPNQREIPRSEKARMVHIASQITGWARTELMSNLYSVITRVPQVRFLYCDTDSLIFAGSFHDSKIALETLGCGTELGQYKKEYEGIRMFQSMAPKMYRLELNNSSLYKLKGASQKYNSLEQLTLMFDQVEETHKSTYTQLQWKRCARTSMIQQVEVQKQINIFHKRHYSISFDSYNVRDDQPLKSYQEAMKREAEFEQLNEDQDTLTVAEIIARERRDEIFDFEINEIIQNERESQQFL